MDVLRLSLLPLVQIGSAVALVSLAAVAAEGGFDDLFRSLRQLWTGRR